MSGQGAMGDRGCPLGAMVVIGMVLAALFVVMSVLSSACAPAEPGGTTRTTRENVCGETGVCEGSLGLDVERDRSAHAAMYRPVALGALVQSNASSEPTRRIAAAAGIRSHRQPRAPNPLCT